MMWHKNNSSSTIEQKKSINIGGKLMDLSIPCVMGIINITDDSFYCSSRFRAMDKIIERAESIINEGGRIIDIGAASSRPGAIEINPDEEYLRLEPAVSEIKKRFPTAVISVDCTRSSIIRKIYDSTGAIIVNDISAGQYDEKMFETVAELQLPYIMMHVKGRPENMQINPQYDNIVKEILLYFAIRINELRSIGLNDIIIDPGIGFGKTVEHNFEIIVKLDDFKIAGLPLLIGVSRKSLIYKTLDISAIDALNGTTVLNTIALLKGASILRVHDVKEAVQAVSLVSKVLISK